MSALSLAAWPQRGARLLHQFGPGLALAGVIAMAATLVTQQHGGPQLLYALFFGIAFHHLSAEPRTRPGIEWCARGMLRLGVGLLGARITAEQIAALGWTTAAVVAAGVCSTIAFGVLLARRLRLGRDQGLLSGCAVGICGASAALAVAAVLPSGRRQDRFTLTVVVCVTVMSTAAMVLYPLLASALQLPPALAGLFLGGTIHDVAQVVGAGYTLGHDTGDVATVVKLLRVAMLALVVLAISIGWRSSRRRHGAGARPALLPWFLWLFIGMVLLNSVGALSSTGQALLSSASRTCLVLAIAALGVKTSFAKLAAAGWRPLLLIGLETLWLALLVLAAVLWLR